MSEPSVKRIRARSVVVPLEFPVRTSVGVVPTSPLVLIDIETSAGVTGRSYLFTYTPAALRATTEMVTALGSLLEGTSAAPIAADHLLSSRLRLLGRTGLAQMACAGIDMALWDALAIAEGVPLVRLLGGTPQPVKAYDSHSMDGVELGVVRARRAIEAGYRAIKTKVGYPTLEEDLRVVESLRQAVGPAIAIMVDFNQGLNAPEAIRRICALEQHGIAWVEEPTIQEDLRGYAAIRAHVRTPVQMGENWWGPLDFQRSIESAACDLAMPDAMKIGGVTGWLRAAAIAQTHNIPMSSHIFQEVSAHLLAVSPTAHWLERMDLAGAVMARPLVFREGSAIIADEPGTGISWNEEAVSLYTAR